MVGAITSELDSVCLVTPRERSKIEDWPGRDPSLLRGRTALRPQPLTPRGRCGLRAQAEEWIRRMGGSTGEKLSDWFREPTGAFCCTGLVATYAHYPRLR